MKVYVENGGVTIIRGSPAWRFAVERLILPFAEAIQRNESRSEDRVVKIELRNVSESWRRTPFEGPSIAVEAAFDWRTFQVDDFSTNDIILPPALAGAVARRQAEFLAGRMCARQALSLSGCPIKDVGVHSDRSPIWPDGFVGSITHSGGLAGAVVAPASMYLGLGIDFEALIPADQARDIKPAVLTKTDNAILRGRTGHSFEHHLTLVFSLKECLYKALYPRLGRLIDFHDIGLAGFGDGKARMRLNQTLTAELQEDMEFEASYSFSNGLIRTCVQIRR